jgi:hypothetical protein
MAKNCCQKFKSLIQEIDLFGTFITFRINDDIEYKSVIGGCSTILFSIFTFFYTLYYSCSFLDRKNIDYKYSTKTIESSPFLNLTSEKFNFAFGVQKQEDGDDYTYESEDENFFNYSVELIEWVGFNEDEIPPQTIIKNLDVKLCDKEDFYYQVDNTFENIGLETSYCPNVKNINFTLEGLYTDYYFKYLRINISLSNYGINHLNEVDTYLKKEPLEMAIYYIDSTIDYQRQYNFMTPYINYIYRGIDLNFIKYLYLFISPIEFTNDQNILFDDPHTKNTSTLDFSYDSFRFVSSRDDKDLVDKHLLGQIIVKVSPKIFQLSRIYQKFPSFIADLCGILEEIMVITLIIVNIIERKLVDEKLVNRMLKFKGSKYYNVNHLINLFNSDKNSNNIMKIIKKPNLFIEKKENFSLLDTELKHYNIFSYTDENLIKFKFQKKKINPYFENTDPIKNTNSVPLKKGLFDDALKVNIFKTCTNRNFESINEENNSHNNSYCSLKFKKKKKLPGEKDDNKNIKIFPLTKMENIWASLFFWCSNLQRKRYEIIKKAENKIHYYLDIYTYIKKMQEIDLIKYCLFDNEQMNLFDFLSNPPIKIENLKGKFIYQEFERKQINVKSLGLKEMDDIFTSYNNIRNKKNVSFEDLKLLRLVKAEVDFLKN